MTNNLAPVIEFVKDGTLFLDYSSASLFQECHRKAKLRHILHLVPHEESAALLTGAAVHKALQVWYDTGDSNAAIIAFTRQAHEVGLPIGNEQGLSPAQQKRSIANVINVLQEYFVKWDTDRLDEETIQSEVGFALPLPGVEDVIVCGRIDRVFKRGGRLRMRDFKTTSGIGYNAADRARPNNQPQVYIWAYETLTGEKVTMFDLDLLLIAKEKRTYLRIPFMRSQFDQDEMLSDMQTIARDIRLKIASGEWDRATAQCDSYGGCMYREICNTSNPQPIVESMYRVEPWRPYS